MALHRIEVPGPMSPTGRNGVGFVDGRGSVVVEPRFTEATPFRDGRAAVHEANVGWGIIDEAGSFILQPTSGFDRIGAFSEGLCAAHVREKGWGFVDRGGRTVIPARIRNTWDIAAFPYFSGGLCAVPDDAGALWGFVDATGQTAIPHRFAMARSFHEGLAVVEDAKGRASYVDRSGRPAFPGSWKAAWRFDGDVAAAGAPRAWGVIDRTGAWVHPPELVYDLPHAPVPTTRDPRDWLGRPLAFVEGRAPFRTADKRWGHLAPDGSVAIAPAYEAAGFFSEGLAPVRRKVKGKSRWGFVDVAGKLVVEHVIDHLHAHEGFGDGLVPAATREGYGHRWGYLDREGRVAIPHRFDAAYAFRDGLAAVRMGDVNAYVDTRGDVVWRSSS